MYIYIPVNPLTGVETKCNLAIRFAGVQVRQLRICVGVRAGWQVCKQTGVCVRACVGGCVGGGVQVGKCAGKLRM